MKIKVNGKTLDEMTDEERAAYEARKAERGAGLFNGTFGRGPVGKTSKTRFTGAKRLGDYFRNEAERNYYVNRAKSMGGNPQESDLYVPQLAMRGPGDPDAFVAKEDVESRIKSVCAERGLSCEGDIKV